MSTSVTDDASIQRRRCRRVKRTILSIRVALLVLAGDLAGCPGVGGVGGGEDLVDGNRDTALTSPLGKTAGEPNDEFTEPIVAVFDAAGVAQLQGTVSSPGDLDVYLLSDVSPGDRVVIDATTPGSSLDPFIAVFDADGRLAVSNDDRSDMDFDSFVDWIVRREIDRYYLVITNFAGAESRGTYQVDVQSTSGFDVPTPVPQTLVLNFDGGSVDSPVLGTGILDPFDVAAVAPIYEGETETVKAQIRSVFEQNFERFDVTVLTSDDPTPVGVVFSTIHFGGFDPVKFGIAEDVDILNPDLCDDAMIFTESFAPGLFGSVPTAEELGVAIGNVGSHEAGHLLGLSHVSEDRDLMDDVSPADVFLTDQEFMEAALAPGIMAIGTQDGVLLLEETVGPRSDAPTRPIMRELATGPLNPWREFERVRPVSARR